MGLIPLAFNKAVLCAHMVIRTGSPTVPLISTI